MTQQSHQKSGCLGLLLQLFGVSPTAKPMPYRLRDDFLSAAEISFYHVLLSAAGDDLTVCPKVNLGDIFFVGRRDIAARNRISSKHVDFLLCDSRSMQPKAGIELDDSSHARQDRQDRDAFVQEVFAAAGLPLLRFPAQRAYTISEITAQLSPLFVKPSAAPALPTDQEATSVPVCPKCGIPLILRTGSRGKFYGCTNFPMCRQTVAIP